MLKIVKKRVWDATRAVISAALKGRRNPREVAVEIAKKKVAAAGK